MDSIPVKSSSSSIARRSVDYSPPPPPPPPARWVSKTVEEKRQNEAARYGSDDRWSSLKAYR